MPNPPERLGFTLTQKKNLCPTEIKEGGLGGFKVGWVGLIQNNPPPSYERGLVQYNTSAPIAVNDPQKGLCCIYKKNLRPNTCNEYRNTKGDCLGLIKSPAGAKSYKSYGQLYLPTTDFG